LQCTGNKYHVSKKNLTDEEHEKAVLKKIKKNYDLFKSADFINKFKDILNKNKSKSDIHINSEIKKFFDNRILIIDECHELRKKHDSDKLGETNIKILSTLEKILHVCDNIKLILMSATPMYDQPDEIIDIINLFKINQKQKKINTEDIFDTSEKSYHLTKHGEDILKESSKGIISYYRGYNPISFPLILEPDSKLNRKLYSHVKMYIPKNTHDYKNNIIPDSEKNRFTKLTKCAMSKFQEKHYFQELQEIELDIAFKSSSDLMNFIYPIDKLGNIMFGNKGFRIAFKDLYNGTYQYKPYNEGFLTEKNLEKYSTKFHSILTNVRVSPGICFIYFIYKYATKTIGMILEEAGYLPTNNKPLLNNPSNSDKICSICNLYKSNQIHKNTISKKYHKFRQAHYIIITGDTGQTERDKIISLTKKHSNIHGEDIKIIIGSKVLSQSVDLKNIRQIHLGNAWHNMSQITQIIGRGSRFCSHVDLDENNRDVTIFRYSCSTINGKIETIDEKLWRTAENKDITIKKIERILKQNAIDCHLNRNANHFNKKDFEHSNDEDYTSYCDYDVCDYKCFNENKTSKKTDDSTYNYVELKTEQKREIEYFIKNYFIHDNILSIKYLLNEFKNTDETIIYNIINSFIGNDDSKYPESIYHKKEIGYLTLNNGHLVFNDLKNFSNKIGLFNDQVKNNDMEIRLDKIKKEISKKKTVISIDKIIDELVEYDRPTCDLIIEHKYHKERPIIAEYLITHANTNKITSLSEMPKKYKNIILYFEKLIFQRKFLSEDPSDNVYAGYTLSNKYTCFKKDIFKECNFEENRLLNKNFEEYHIKQLNLNKKESMFVGYIVVVKNKVNFKIIDRTSQNLKKRIDEKIMKTSLYKGKICDTYDKKNLNQIVDYLDIDISKINKINRNTICELIELRLRYYEHINKNGLRWFYNIEEWNQNKN